MIPIAINTLIWVPSFGRREIGNAKSSDGGLHYVTEDYYETSWKFDWSGVRFEKKVMCPRYGAHLVLAQLATEMKNT